MKCIILILICVLNKKVGGFLNSTLSVLIKSVVASLVMSAVVIGASYLLGMWLGDSVIYRIIKLFVPTGIGMAVYAGMLYVLRVEQIKEVVNSILVKLHLKKREG